MGANGCQLAQRSCSTLCMCSKYRMKRSNTRCVRRRYTGLCRTNRLLTSVSVQLNSVSLFCAGDRRECDT